MAQTPNITDKERAVIIAALKLQARSTDRAAKAYQGDGRHATARTLFEEISEISALIDKIRTM